MGGIGGVLGKACGAIAESDIFAWRNLNFRSATGEHRRRINSLRSGYRRPAMSILQEIGPDIVTVANNHALDYGTDALLDTCDTLDSAGILHVGAGKNLEERSTSANHLRKMEKDWLSGRVTRLSDGRMGGRIVWVCFRRMTRLRSAAGDPEGKERV